MSDQPKRPTLTTAKKEPAFVFEGYFGMSHTDQNGVHIVHGPFDTAQKAGEPEEVKDYGDYMVFRGRIIVEQVVTVFANLPESE